MATSIIRLFCVGTLLFNTLETAQAGWSDWSQNLVDPTADTAPACTALSQW